MRIGVVGVNFKSSPLEIREELAKACQYCFSPRALNPWIKNTVLLSTCNRTEVYFSASELAEAQTEIIFGLRRYISQPFEQKLYSFFGPECFLHLAKVASGLDSAILSETEVQNQVRLAYKNSSEAGKLTTPLHFLFQKSLKISKSIRSTFPLPRGLPSLESTLLELIPQSGMHEQAKILFIGNSQINRQIISFFQARGKYSLTLCSRRNEGYEGITTLGYEALPSWRMWDVVICGTSQGRYLLHRDGKTCLQRHLLIDLSVPRLIDPLIAQDPLIQLFNMEEIGTFVNQHRHHLLQQIDASQTFLEEAVNRQMELFQERRSSRFACMGF